MTIQYRKVRKIVVERAFGNQAYWNLRVYFTRGKARTFGNFASYQTAADYAAKGIEVA